MDLYQGDILLLNDTLRMVVDDAESGNFATTITLIQVIEHLQLSQVAQLSRIVFEWYQPLLPSLPRLTSILIFTSAAKAPVGSAIGIISSSGTANNSTNIVKECRQ